MQVLITGADGRLGSRLTGLLTQQGYAVTGVDVNTMDITDSASVDQVFRVVKPELVIHCAALTAVDRCATHPDEALAINGFGTQTIALASQAHRAVLLYMSTNEVFDGQSRRPYQEYDRPNPANPYGYSKWVGEQIVRDLVPAHYIVRTSWLFAHGGHNFVQAILRQAQQDQPLRVVTNEISTPTYNNDLAIAISQLIRTGRFGIYHLVNSGHTSRYAFAQEILRLAGYGGLTIEPISLVEYQRASRPPEHAVLRNVAAARLGIVLRSWQDALVAFLESERIHTPREVS